MSITSDYAQWLLNFPLPNQLRRPPMDVWLEGVRVAVWECSTFSRKRRDDGMRIPTLSVTTTHSGSLRTGIRIAATHSNAFRSEIQHGTNRCDAHCSETSIRAHLNKDPTSVLSVVDGGSQDLQTQRAQTACKTGALVA